MASLAAQPRVIRTLVPYFVPDEVSSGTPLVNDQLADFVSASSPVHRGSDPRTLVFPIPVNVTVREWNHKEGYFVNKTVQVLDVPPPVCLSSTPPKSLSSLSSPVEARSRSSSPRSHNPSRRTASPPKSKRTPVSSFSTSPVKSQSVVPSPSPSTKAAKNRPALAFNSTRKAAPSPVPAQTPVSCSNKESPNNSRPATPPQSESSAARYAGFTFDLASPDPTTIPLPSFLTKSEEAVVSFSTSMAPTENLNIPAPPVERVLFPDIQPDAPFMGVSQPLFRVLKV